MVGALQLWNGRAGHHLVVGDDRHPVAQGVEAVEVVGDHEHRQVKAFRESLDQGVELLGPDRVEPGGRLVEEQQFGIQGQRPGEGDALAHAAGKLRRAQVAGEVGQARHGQLEIGEVVDQRDRQGGVLAIGRADVLAHAQGREQGPALEQHSPAALQGAPLAPGDPARIDAEHPHLAAIGPLQPDQGVQKHGLARAGAAH